MTTSATLLRDQVKQLEDIERNDLIPLVLLNSQEKSFYDLFLKQINHEERGKFKISKI